MTPSVIITEYKKTASGATSKGGLSSKQGRHNLMARPIEPTPELRGKDAELLLKQVEERKLTPEKEAELKKDARLFEEKRPRY